MACYNCYAKSDQRFMNTLPDLIARFETDTNRLTTLVDPYEHSCADEQSRIVQPSNESAMIDSNITAKRRELEVLEQSSTAEEQAISALQDERLVLESKIEEDNQVLEQRETRRMEMENLRETLSLSRQELEKLEERVRSEQLDVESERAKLEAGTDALRASADNLRRSVSSLPLLDANAEISDLSAEFQRLAKLLISDRNKFTNKIAEIEAQQRTEAKRWSDERHDFQRELTQLRVEVNIHSKVKQELWEANEARRIGTDKIVLLEKSITDVRQQLAACESKLQASMFELADEKAATKEQARALRDDCRQYEAENKRLIDLDVSRTHKMDELKNTNKMIHEQSRELNRDIRELRKAKAEMQDQITIMGNVVTKRDELINSARATHTQLQSDIKTQVLEIKELEENVSALTQEISDAQERLNSAQEQLQQARSTTQHVERAYLREPGEKIKVMKQLDQQKTDVSKLTSKHWLLFDDSEKVNATLVETRAQLDKERKASEKLTTRCSEQQKAIQEHVAGSKSHLERIKQLETAIATFNLETERYKTQLHSVQLQFDNRSSELVNLVDLKALISEVIFKNIDLTVKSYSGLFNSYYNSKIASF